MASDVMKYPSLSSLPLSLSRLTVAASFGVAVLAPRDRARRRRRRRTAGASGRTSDGAAVWAARGLAVGPYVGYKYTAPFGLAFNAQLGAQYVTLRGEAHATNDPSIRATSKAEPSIIPLLNLNLGWAF